jgi:hypothetical protein
MERGLSACFKRSALPGRRACRDHSRNGVKVPEHRIATLHQPIASVSARWRTVRPRMLGSPLCERPGTLPAGAVGSWLRQLKSARCSPRHEPLCSSSVGRTLKGGHPGPGARPLPQRSCPTMKVSCLPWIAPDHSRIADAARRPASSRHPGASCAPSAAGSPAPLRGCSTGPGRFRCWRWPRPRNS